MRASTQVDAAETLDERGGVTLLLQGVAFPAGRDDLLLHAIASHAVPSVIEALRALPPFVYEDADSVRAALIPE
jgi:hypothetical protein